MHLLPPNNRPYREHGSNNQYNYLYLDDKRWTPPLTCYTTVAITDALVTPLIKLRVSTSYPFPITNP